MITVVDNAIAANLQQNLAFPSNRVVYGPLEHARNYWIRRYEGKESLPYMSFHRRIEFEDEDRGVRGPVFVTTPGDAIYRARWVRVRVSYTLEHICDKISEQTDLIRRYIFWAASSPVVRVPDTRFDGEEWAFPIDCESPEDASDLESEDETGRIIRTTLIFSVKAVLVDFDNEGEGTEYGVIHEVLGRIHLYDGADISTATEILPNIHVS